MINDSCTCLFCYFIIVSVYWFLINFCTLVIWIWADLCMRIIVNVWLLNTLLKVVRKKSSFTFAYSMVAFLKKGILRSCNIWHCVRSRIWSLSQEHSFLTMFLKLVYLLTALAKSISWLTLLASSRLRHFLDWIGSYVRIHPRAWSCLISFVSLVWVSFA